MDKLVEVLAEIFRMPKEEITDDVSINNTDKWDSLKHMELVVAIEGAFEITLTADEIVSMMNVAEIKNVLRTKGVEI